MSVFRFVPLIILLVAGHFSLAQLANIKVEKVWDQAPHNAFPDIRFYNGYFYCVFRESNFHVPQSALDNGKIRVLRSINGENWQPLQLIQKNGLDLRDPMLEITSDYKLMLLIGGSIYNQGKLIRTQTQVSFLQGNEFSVPVPVNYDADLNSTHNWLWSITWNKGSGFGFIYQFEPGTKGKLMMAKTLNGIDYSSHSSLAVEGNESKALFVNNRKMIMVARRDKASNNLGAFGISKKPFKQWTFKDLPIRLGGPHLIKATRKYWILSTRGFKSDRSTCTTLYSLRKTGQITKLVDLPECGKWDCSYPGMEIYKHHLFVAYYSGHEGKTAIYIAIIPLQEISKQLKRNKQN